MLALILGIAGSGLLMKFGWHTDVVALKVFMLGVAPIFHSSITGGPFVVGASWFGGYSDVYFSHQ